MIGRIDNNIVFSGVNEDDVIEYLEDNEIEYDDNLVEKILNQLEAQIDQSGIYDFVSNQISNAIEEVS